MKLETGAAARRKSCRPGRGVVLAIPARASLAMKGVAMKRNVEPPRVTSAQLVDDRIREVKLGLQDLLASEESAGRYVVGAACRHWLARLDVCASILFIASADMCNVPQKEPPCRSERL